MKRFKVIINQDIELHQDALNDHQAIADALARLRNANIMDVVKIITCNVIS